MILPTLRFLLKSQEQQKVKRQDQILLILRTLLLALLALALSRPLIRHGVVGDVAQRKVIILLDGSASSNQKVGVTSSFGLAVKKASSMIKELPKNSEVTAFVLNDQVELAVEKQTDLFMAASKIESLRPSLGSSPIADGISRVSEYVTASKMESPEVYIFSDFQKYTWTKASASGQKAVNAMTELNKLTKDVFMVDVGGQSDFNIIVESLSPTEWVLTAGNPVKFLVNIKTVGKAPSGKKGNVSFLVNDEKKDFREFDLDKEQYSFSFDYQFGGAGEYLIQILAEGDEHAIDNERFFLCNIPEDHNILILDDSAEFENQVNISYFLQLAISPPDTPGTPKNSRFKPKTVNPAKIVYENLSKFSAIMIRSTTNLSEPMAKKIENYVSDGGAVCFFAGKEINAFEYNRFFYKDGSGLLPRKLGPKKSDNPAPYPMLSEGMHPALAELVSRKDIKDAGFTEYLTFEGEGLNDVVMKLSNGVPAILEKTYGKGKSLFINTSIEPSWSFLSLTAEYPILIQEILRYIIGSPDAVVNLSTGETHSQSVYVSNQKLLLRYPNGMRASLTPQEGEDKSSLRVRFDRTNQQGVYRFDVPDGVLARNRFIVNADAEEGDLSRYSQSDLQGSLGGTSWKWIKTSESLEDFVSKLNSVTELTDGVLWLLVLSILMESFLAAKFGKRRGGKAA